MIKSYRKWLNAKNEVFYLSEYDDTEDKYYYCEAEYYEDSYRFDKEFIEKESIEATQEEIENYKINKAKYN